MRKNDRLNPKLFSSRYVVLSQLRDATIEHMKELTQNSKGKILVDFGCGDMPYRSIIEPMVGQYLGVDLIMNTNAKHHIDFDSKTSLPDNYADIILSNQVLEHVDNPSGYLQEAIRILKPGGSIICTTHGFWYYHPTPNDYWRWTSAGLKKTIEKEGFEIKSFFGILGLSASGIQLFQDGIAVKLATFLVPPFAFIMQLLIMLFNKINSQTQRNRDAALYVVVAKKA